MLALRYQVWRGITEQEWTNHQTVKHSTHSVTVSILYTVVGFHFYITLLHGLQFLLQQTR